MQGNRSPVNVSIGQVGNKERKLGNSKRDRKKSTDVRNSVMRDWMWGVKRGS